MIKWRRLEPDMFPAHDSSGPPNAKAETPAAEMGAELPSFGVWGAQSTRKRLTAQDVISARFEASGRRGESYLAVQVDDFLDEVAWSIAQYEKELEELRRRLS
ncbi:DivIVA domain-containing protein [Actinomycetaceae bacterium L2_0104]